MVYRNPYTSTYESIIEKSCNDSKLYNVSLPRHHEHHVLQVGWVVEQKILLQMPKT